MPAHPEVTYPALEVIEAGSVHAAALRTQKNKSKRKKKPGRYYKTTSSTVLLFSIAVTVHNNRATALHIRCSFHLHEKFARWACPTHSKHPNTYVREVRGGGHPLKTTTFGWPRQKWNFFRVFHNGHMAPRNIKRFGNDLEKVIISSGYE